MLIERFDRIDVLEGLKAKDRFHPYPKADDREQWNKLPNEARAEWVTAGERALSYEWPILPATKYMEYKRNGNRSHYQSIYWERRNKLIELVFAECAEGKERFLDAIINGVWAICEETTWCYPAHNHISKKNADEPLPDVTDSIIDIAAGETADLLSWVYYLLKGSLDRITDRVCSRIQTEIKRRILDAYLDREDFWWMGFGEKRVNNWNPWVNSNCLSAFLLIEDDKDRRMKAVRKIMRSLDQFIGIYCEDGGCDEGPHYWDFAGGSLFDCLELLYLATEGEINVYDVPLIQEIGRYILRAHIAEDYFVNFADSSATIQIAGDVVFRYGKRIQDQAMASFGLAAKRRGKREGILTIQRLLPALFGRFDEETVQGEISYVKDAWLPGIQFMTARERDGTSQGLFLAAKGGHNNESHNHNDIGHFIVYANGKPMLIDVGVETYTAKTFSDERYEIWTMQSAYHNVPTVNGVDQKAGSDYKATEVVYRSDKERTEISINIATAYPAEAGIAYWRRMLVLQRLDEPYVEIVDSFQIKQSSDAIVLNLMTPYEPFMPDSQTIRLRCPDCTGVDIAYDGDRYDATYEQIRLEDEKLRFVWGDCLFRIKLQIKSPVSEEISVLRIKQICGT